MGQVLEKLWDRSYKGCGTGPSKVVGQVQQRLRDRSNIILQIIFAYIFNFRSHKGCGTGPTKVVGQVQQRLRDRSNKDFIISTPSINKKNICEGPRIVASGPENFTSVGQRPHLTVCEL